MPADQYMTVRSRAADLAQQSGDARRARLARRCTSADAGGRNANSLAAALQNDLCSRSVSQCRAVNSDRVAPGPLDHETRKPTVRPDAVDDERQRMRMVRLE